MKEILSKINKSYSIDPINFKEKVSLGYLSNNFILENQHFKYFLKEYQILDGARIKEVHATKFFFASKEIPIILPLRESNGDTFFQNNGKYYALFPFIKGRIIKRVERSKTAIESTGSMLGKIHLLSKLETPNLVQKKSKPWDKDKFLNDAEIILKEISANPHDSFNQLAAKIIKLKSSLVKSNNIGPTDLNLKNDHLIHGDYHGLNLFFDKNDQIQSVFDLEKTELAPRAYEIARALDLLCFSQQYDSEAFQAAHIFLKGYSNFYPITEKELLNGFTFYYLKKIHSLWIETEHYIKKNYRVDHFLQSEFIMLDYYQNNIEKLVRSIV